MIAILEKYEHNADFHQIVNFVEASHIRYALTINPTVYVSHIRQFWSTARIETTNEGTKILATVDGKLRTISESSIKRNLKLNDEAGISSLPDAEFFENLALMGPKSTGFNEFSSNIATAVVCLATNRVYNFSKMTFDGTLTEPHHTPSPEAQQSPRTTTTSSPSLPSATTKTIPTVTPTVIPQLRQYFKRARIAQSLAFPTAADEPASPFGGWQSRAVCNNNSMNCWICIPACKGQTEMASKIASQELEITSLKARIKLLEDKDGGGTEPSREDTTIKGRSLETGEEAVIEKSTEREVATVSVPTSSGLVVPTASLIFTTAYVVTPYSRRKGKKKMVESDTPKKKKLQEQIDVQVAREMEEQMAREDQRRNEQNARDAEIARIHAEEELQMLIDDHHVKILKYQAQQSKPLSKKQQREFYMSVLKSHAGWKIKHFKGMSLEEIREKFVLVWKKIEDFVSMGSKEEGERFKRKGLRIEHESSKKIKTSEEVSQEDFKEMMHLVPVEEVYIEALQVKHPIIDWEIHSEGQRIYWKIIRLGGSTTSYQFFVDMLKYFDREDLTQMWTLVKETLNIRHATMEWRLYDTCGVHYVLSRDQEIFMLVEKDYPLRKGLAIVMIINKLQVENYSQMASDLIQKIHKIANSLRQRDD
nr:hypothetical protein [Tanacetum cinerariifolium]